MYQKVLAFLLTVLVAMYALNNSPSPPKDSRPHTQGLLLLKICICISIGVWNLTILLDVGGPGHESLQSFMGGRLSQVWELHQHTL